MKNIIWLAGSLQKIKSYTTEAREDIGFHLYTLQLGQNILPHFVMSGIGSRVKCIQVQYSDIYRVVFVEGISDDQKTKKKNYINILPEAIYVLHAFCDNRKDVVALNYSFARQIYKSIERM